MRSIQNWSEAAPANIGETTVVSPYVLFAEGTTIGNECYVGPHCVFEKNIIIADNVSIGSGVHFCSDIRVKDSVSIGSNVSFTKRAFIKEEEHALTVVEIGALIGDGAIIYNGVSIGQYATVSPGALISRSVPPYAIVEGNPARIVGYVNSANTPSLESKLQHNDGTYKSIVNGVSLHSFPLISDIRGSLTVGEFERSIPFPVKRYFMVFDVPSAETRGEHAHHQCHQFLICVKGSISVVADDGSNREEFLLNRPELGLYLPPMTWGIQYKYSSDAVLLVLASEHYDAKDYIRNYDDFLALTR